MNLYFNELEALVTPRAEKKLRSLDSERAKITIGRFAESLLLNDRITIPINGLALIIVVLVRLLGHEDTVRLMEKGAINFFFNPGMLGYITEENKRALSLSGDTGLTWIVGKSDGWDNILDAVRVALVEQLDYPLGKARRFARRIEKFTLTGDNNISKKAIEATYFNAKNLIDDCNINEIGDLKKLDSSSHLIGKLFSIFGAYLDLICTSYTECSDVYGNDLTWDVINNLYDKIDPNEKELTKLNKILEFEGIPDISQMISKGFALQEIIKMRNDAHITDFRNWLRSAPNCSDLDLLKAYYDTFKSKTSEKISLKTLRLGIPTLLGFLGPIGAILSPILSVGDSFLADRIVNGWNPKLFIDKHFQYKTDFNA